MDENFALAVFSIANEWGDILINCQNCLSGKKVP